MSDWFTIDHIDEDTHIISEYRHWEETHRYLLVGAERALLIDTDLGVCNISGEVRELTDKPVTAVAPISIGTTSAATSTSRIFAPMRRN